MGQKFVLQNPKITIEGTDRSDQFNQVTLETSRDDIDATVFGDRSVRTEKGQFTNRLVLNFRPDADRVFQRIVLGYYDGEATQAVTVLFDNSKAQGADNPLLQDCAIHFSSPGPLGGTKNALEEGGITCNIQGGFELDWGPSGGPADVQTIGK